MKTAPGFQVPSWKFDAFEFTFPNRKRKNAVVFFLIVQWVFSDIALVRSPSAGESERARRRLVWGAGGWDQADKVRLIQKILVPTCFISTKAAVQSMIPPKGLQHHDSNHKSLTHCCLNPLNWNLNFPHNHKATYFPSVCALVSQEISLFKQTSPKKPRVSDVSPRRINDRMRLWTRCSWNSSMLLMTSQITNNWRAPVGTMASFRKSGGNQYGKRHAQHVNLCTTFSTKLRAFLLWHDMTVSLSLSASIRSTGSYRSPVS